ncbi:hypothetical protein [Stieleria mannarensis]|uniref:hypothetical protein n=1 Tax=Stieleria mannarensis TaxID=2755585 RepID=UPI001603C947|nr:hypothetical protein [Rhodopirellula sp. JC639]
MIHHSRLPFFEINPLAARCVAGYTWTFSTPKPLSRISLVDLPSGKAINSEPVECNMCPLAVLNDGKTVLMQGTGGDRDGFETGDQLQLWNLTGSKVTRSGIWVPFKDDKKAFGKTSNAHPIKAIPIDGDLLLLLGDNGHLACFDLPRLAPVWHARLSRNFAVTLTTDRKQMFVLDELGKRPDLSFFETVALPKLLQAPTKSSAGNAQNALLVSKFTMRGWVDSQ